MRAVDEHLLATGHYARKQILCGSRLVAFSHRARFRLARQLVQPFASHKLLDYGSGDGTFLVMVHDLFPCAVGADIEPEQIRDCADRLGALEGLSFLVTPQLADPSHTAAYGIVTCMEVLEHCPDKERHAVLLDLHRLVAPEGTVIVSVPLETGPSLIGKQVFRRVAGWRRLGDYEYTERYTIGEFLRMVFAHERATIDRPTHRVDLLRGGSIQCHGHKGFNWRTLRAELDRLFHVETLLFSPVRWLGSYLNSQVWLVCKRR